MRYSVDLHGPDLERAHELLRGAGIEAVPAYVGYGSPDRLGALMAVPDADSGEEAEAAVRAAVGSGYELEVRES